MRSRVQKQSKLRHYMGAPARFLGKARDFYVDNMLGFDGKVGFGNMMVCPVPHMANLSNNVAEKKDEMKLFRTVSMTKVELDSHRQPGRRPPVVARNAIGRSLSVGVGKMGRIDEDKPYDFGEEETSMKSDFLFARSRSHVATKRNVRYY